MRKLLVAVALVIASSSPCLADFRDALDAYKQGKDNSAYREFIETAKLGDPRSRLMIGVMYGEGRGVRRSDFMAHVWFILASNSARYGKLHQLAEKYRSVFAKELSNAQLIEAGRLAREWSIQWRQEIERAGL